MNPQLKKKDLPCAGAYIFKYRQSSDWLTRNGNILLRYSSRPFDTLFRTAVSFLISGKTWGHTGLNLSATLIPDQRAPVTGGMNLSEASGGEAYGIPLKTSTGSKYLDSRVTITPLRSPYFVLTTLELRVPVPAPEVPEDEDDRWSPEPDAASHLTVKYRLVNGGRVNMNTTWKRSMMNAGSVCPDDERTIGHTIGRGAMLLSLLPSTHFRFYFLRLHGFTAKYLMIWVLFILVRSSFFNWLRSLSDSFRPEIKRLWLVDSVKWKLELTVAHYGDQRI